LGHGEIDPTIFGTLFERFLDPDKRAQIGAHYTDPEKERGPTVGFYGGINYGFGYGGVGFSGGYWNNGAFSYNTAVTNLSNTHIGNTYNAPVTINRTTNVTRNVSYNGGQGGTTRRSRPMRPSSTFLRPRRRSSTSRWPAQIRRSATPTTRGPRLSPRRLGPRCLAARA